jgi:hypothetical protein
LFNQEEGMNLIQRVKGGASMKLKLTGQAYKTTRLTGYQFEVKKI